jgi:protein-S-isoprenylcysteine O-methyltransferase Ste14
MLLVDSLVRHGDIAFRNRGMLALLLAPPYVLALRQSGWLEQSYGAFPNSAWQFSCLLVALAGLGLRVLTAGTVPRRTSGRNKAKGQVADSLNTTGVYSLVRNPLYLANFLIVLGVMMLPAVWWMVVLGSCFFWLWYERIILAEEAYLRVKFGAEYERWAQRTPAILPSFRNYRAPSLPFSVRTAVKREYLTMMSLTACFVVLIHLEQLAAGGPASVDFKIEATLAGGAVFASCLVIRYLRQHTRVLHVAGR